MVCTWIELALRDIKGGCRVRFFEVWLIGSPGYPLSNDPGHRSQIPDGAGNHKGRQKLVLAAIVCTWKELALRDFKGGVGFFEIWSIGSPGYPLSNDPGPRSEVPMLEEQWTFKVHGPE
ncbi:hypothetical protein BX616_002079 [Lobosporangium transversale]|nr:hypothetical protein BX616_002079 [Lobosporangium transversale]